MINNTTVEPEPSRPTVGHETPRITTESGEQQPSTDDIQNQKITLDRIKAIAERNSEYVMLGTSAIVTVDILYRAYERVTK